MSDQLESQSTALLDREWAEARDWYVRQRDGDPAAMFVVVHLLSDNQPGDLLKCMAEDAGLARIVQLLAGVALHQVMDNEMKENKK